MVKYRYVAIEQKLQKISVSVSVRDALEKLDPLGHPVVQDDLKTDYLNQLDLLLSSKFAVAPIMEKLTLNMFLLLGDKEIPAPIKLMSINKMSEMALILGQMGQIKKTLLLDQFGQPLFPRYSLVADELRSRLQTSNDPSGVTFTGRSPKLFEWTEVMIGKTMNPLVKFVLSKLPEEKVADANARFKLLNKLSNLLVLHIACGDDIADNIQHKVLTEKFAEMPSRSKEQAKEMTNAIRADKRLRRFADYSEYTQNVWDDAMVQLENLLGDYFTGEKREQFHSIHSKVMGSLTYSLFMNKEPHDPTITVDSISENLDPNIMIQCVRYLEQLLAEKIADENSISLPTGKDIEILNDIISLSQKNAADANAAATAPRELLECDLSSVFPFEMNTLYLDRLFESDSMSSGGYGLGRLFDSHSVAESEGNVLDLDNLVLHDLMPPPPGEPENTSDISSQSVAEGVDITPIRHPSQHMAKFVPAFEKFLVRQGYNNHFFESYYEKDRYGCLNIPNDFDYLSLLVLRRQILTDVVTWLNLADRHGVDVPNSDYSIRSLGKYALPQMEQSKDENLRQRAFALRKAILHIELINKFTDELSESTGVQTAAFEKWADQIDVMQKKCDGIQNKELVQPVRDYIESFKVFLSMYILFKRVHDGTV